jgi:hypothetical protein
VNLIRFTHDWNVGIMCFGLRLVEPTARRGSWDVGNLEKFFVDMGGNFLNKKNIPLKNNIPSFHYSIIPCPGQKHLPLKNIHDFIYL